MKHIESTFDHVHIVRFCLFLFCILYVLLKVGNYWQHEIKLKKVIRIWIYIGLQWFSYLNSLMNCALLENNNYKEIKSI